jgi:hypothetical protein
LFFSLADDGDVIAFAHDLDEPWDAAHRGLVDADQLGPSHRRLHVARMHHARQLHVNRPLQRSVHLGGDVVTLGRCAHDFQILNGFDLRLASGGVDAIAREGDVESLAANQLAVGDLLRGVRLDRDHTSNHGEVVDRDSEASGRHREKHAPGLGRDPSHRPAVGLNGIRAS